MAESAPNMTEREENRTDLFDKGFGKGAAKAREELARSLGLKSADELTAYAERTRKAETDRLTAEGKTSELLALKDRELSEERTRRESAEAENRNVRFEIAFRAEASRKGVDADLAYLLVRPEERILDEKGAAVGVASLVDRIAKEKPLLKVGNGSGPVGAAGLGGASGADTSDKGKKLTELRAQYDQARKDPRSAADILVTLSRQIQTLERSA